MKYRTIQTLENDSRLARVRYCSEYHEYSVTFWTAGKMQTEATYYADDKTDAINTATLWVSQDKLALQSVYNNLSF